MHSTVRISNVCGVYLGICMYRMYRIYVWTIVSMLDEDAKGIVTERGRWKEVEDGRGSG